MRPARPLLLALVTLASVLLPAASATALSYPVTSPADTDAKGTLRGSIEEANADPGADTIPIEVTGAIRLETALPPVIESLEIQGPGAADLTIERKAGAAPFRVLAFTAHGVVRGMTISNGQDPLGAGILSEAGGLMLIGVVVTGNEARSEGGSQAVARGGGVASFGPLAVSESTIWGNDAFAAGGSSETMAAGGGIVALGSLTIGRSTISGNSAQTPAAESEGGAIAGGIQAIEVESANSTIAGNFVSGKAFATAANLASESGTLRNTIVADPKGDEESCFGTVASGGFNLDEDGSCGFGQGSDLVGVTAGLDPVLKDNGGPTPTHALLASSIAIDRGNSFGEKTDQRGLPRPSDFPAISNKEGGDGSDIGAFELQAPPPAAPILVQAVHGDRTPPNTRIVSGPARVTFERQAKFRFASSEGQSRFQCKLDKRRWRGCRNPYKGWVSAGAKHLFKVRAIDRFGNVDPSPARFGWRVKPLS
ncbi:MAG TPA: choice-of-anchor Q domain-containing protein [Solirubrobacterales bacterium]